MGYMREGLDQEQVNHTPWSLLGDLTGLSKSVAKRVCAL